MPRVTQKGQVTIPVAVRKVLGVKVGDVVRFEIQGGEVLVRRQEPAAKSLDRFVGFLSHLEGRDSDEIVSELRGTADDRSS